MIPNLVFIISIYVITRYVSFMVNAEQKWIVILLSLNEIVATVVFAYQVRLLANSQTNQ